MFDISKENFFKELIKSPKKNIFIILLFLGFGEWFLSDLINFAGGSIGFFILCFGGYFYLKSEKPKFNEPKDLDGWIKLCNEDLDFFDQGKVFTALKTLPADHRAKVEDFLNNVLKITADEFNRIEDDDGIIAKIKDYVKEYKSNNNIDDLLAKIKNLLR